MSTEQNKTIIRRYFEDVWNAGNVTAIPEIVTSDVTGHVFEGAEKIFKGADVLKERVTSLRKVYANPSFRMEDQIAEGDRVVARWTLTGSHIGEYMGVKPTGKQINVTGTNTFRIANGKIVEIWVNADDLGELQQLGIVPKM